MNILAVDCCLRLTGIAVMRNDTIIGHVKEYLGRKQTAELPKMCCEIMDMYNLSWPELDYIALTNGPGYFTGIRVGAAYATGLAYACGVKMIPVSTLELLPYTFRKTHKAGKILTVIYAGHGFVYASCDGFLEAGEYSHTQILSWLNKNPDAVVISDDPERTALNVKISQVEPDVSAVCEIANANINRAIDPANLRITYYRAPQGAETQKG